MTPDDIIVGGKTRKYISLLYSLASQRNQLITTLLIPYGKFCITNILVVLYVGEIDINYVISTLLECRETNKGTWQSISFLFIDSNKLK